MSVLVKICGLSTPESVDVAVQSGADMVGFVFFARSPRCVSPTLAGSLCDRVPENVERVGLVVDASDDDITAILDQANLDLLQLHGCETPQRVRDISRRFSLPVMKVCAISGANDLATAQTYLPIADALLFDTKPPKQATRPGGNAIPFDWTLLSGHRWPCPWLLAGGLSVQNVAQAVAISGAPGVDVSSGVEDGPGVKNLDKIAEFIHTVKALG